MKFSLVLTKFDVAEAKINRTFQLKLCNQDAQPQSVMFLKYLTLMWEESCGSQLAKGQQSAKPRNQSGRPGISL